MPTSALPDELRDLLARPNPAVMASVRRDGAPVSVATWYLLVPREQGSRSGDRFLANRDSGHKRLDHLRHDARVSLTVLDGDDWYTHVSVQGRVIELRDDEGMVDIDRISSHYTGTRTPSGTVAGSVRTSRWTAGTAGVPRSPERDSAPPDEPALGLALGHPDPTGRGPAPAGTAPRSGRHVLQADGALRGRAVADLPAVGRVRAGVGAVQEPVHPEQQGQVGWAPVLVGARPDVRGVQPRPLVGPWGRCASRWRVVAGETPTEHGGAEVGVLLPLRLQMQPVVRDGGRRLPEVHAGFPCEETAPLPRRRHEAVTLAGVEV